MTRILTFLLSAAVGLYSKATAQVSISSSSVTPLNITSSSLFGLTVINTSTSPMQTMVSVSLVNSASEIICSGKSNPFILDRGLSRLSASRIGIAQFIYGSSAQANFVRISHSVPSGIYKYCAVISILNSGESGDDYCEQIESRALSFLELVSPFDKEEIETKNPVLIWNHSEPFNLLSKGESFRLIVAEITEPQNADAAITANRPIFYHENLMIHQIAYPTDAMLLEPEKKYAWQVQKMSGGVVTQKTEAWEFHLKPPPPPELHQFVVLSSKPEMGYYIPVDNMIYFSFDEGYTSGVADCAIYSADRVKTIPEAREDNNDFNDGSEVKKIGDNRFAIDLATYHLKSGLYMLEVKNVKNEMQMLKFYIK